MIKKIFFALLLLPIIGLSQHTIKGDFTPTEDYKFAILYQVRPNGSYYEADTKFNEGAITIKMDSLAKPGVYKLVYNFPQEENTLEIIYNGKEDIEFTFSEKKGVDFITSTENQLWQNHLKKFTLLQEEIASYYLKTSDKHKIITFKKLSEHHKAAEAKATGTLAYNFIKNYKFYIPKNFEDIPTYQTNLINTYLDNINYENEMLQGTIFLHDITYGYITIKEDYKKAIDTVINKLENTDLSFKKSFLHELWLTLSQNSEIEKANYLATNYLIPTAKKAEDTQMANRVFKFTSLTLGTKAPNFSWEKDGKTKWLHNLEGSQNYILVFWSSGCSHCLAEVPKIHAAIKAMDTAKVKVVAVGLEEEPYEWKNVTQDFPKFINVLGLGKWENKIGNLYDVSGTPTYIVLNSDKKIQAKPESLEQLMDILEKVE